MAELKSLAHPEWPYTGTPHEWRGFVKAEKPKRVRVDVFDPDGHKVGAVYQKQNLGPELK
jgi:hypothetical protein